MTVRSGCDGVGAAKRKLVEECVSAIVFDAATTPIEFENEKMMNFRGQENLDPLHAAVAATENLDCVIYNLLR